MKINVIFIGGIILFFNSISHAENKYQISDHYNGSTFYHRWGASEKSLSELLKWKFTSQKKEWPKYIENELYPTPSTEKDPEKISVTFIGHASVYIQHGGTKFLLDPVWSERTSPVSFMGPKRVRAPGIPIEKIPGVDFVLISHNHYDHLDLPTIKKLSELYNPVFYVALGDGKLLEENGIKNYKEMDWWQKENFAEKVEINFTPAKHWSSRGMFDQNKSLWGGFIVKSKSKQIYYSGDTGYCDIFSEISQKYGSIDFSLLPIGAYEPRWFMKDAHMGPDEAAQAHIDLKSKLSMGVHFGMWQLTDEGIDDPVIGLEKSKGELKIPLDKFITLDVGETKNF